MNKPTPHPKIEHLSTEAIQSLIEKYLAGAKVAELVREFNIKCAPNVLFSILPPRILEQSCSVCGNVMLQELPSRSSIKSSLKIYCSACQHEEGDRCRCKHCQELRAQAVADEKARRQAVIAQALQAEQDQNTFPSFPAEKFPLLLATAFLAFTRCCPINKEALYDPICASPVPFAPTKDHASTLLQCLKLTGLISVSEHSEVGSIVYRDSELTFTPEKVCWSGDINKNIKFVEDLEIIALKNNWPAHWYTEVEMTWLNLALAECREFYDYCLNERKLRVRGEQDITGMLKNILRDFSVGQCYRIIWAGAKNTSDYLARNTGSHSYAGNYMAGACQRYADNARTKGYTLIPFKRNFNLPRSMISYVLFDVILKIGERGFTEPISLAALAAEPANLW